MERIELTKEERENMVENLNGEDLIAYRFMQGVEYLSCVAGIVGVGVSAALPKILETYSTIPITEDNALTLSLFSAGAVTLATAGAVGSMKVIEDHFLRKKHLAPTGYSN